MVCSAIDTSNSQRVLLTKIPKPLSDAVEARRLARELCILRHLASDRHGGGHPNVIRGYDLMMSSASGTLDLYLVTKYMPSNLHEVIYSKNKLSPLHTRWITYQLLCGLGFIHSAGIVHRNLKPSVVLVDERCRVQISEFRLARVVPSKSEPNTDAMTEYVVTRWYRPPEVMCAKVYDCKVDIWSLGCVLAEVLGRKPLFPGSDYIHQMRQILQTLGKPCSSETKFVTNPKALEFIEAFTPAVAVADSADGSENRNGRMDWKELLPRAEPDALSFLQALLRFSPNQRPTAAEALRHPYLEDLFDEATAAKHCTAKLKPVRATQTDDDAKAGHNIMALRLLDEVRHYRPKTQLTLRRRGSEEVGHHQTSAIAAQAATATCDAATSPTAPASARDGSPTPTPVPSTNTTTRTQAPRATSRLAGHTGTTDTHTDYSNSKVALPASASSKMRSRGHRRRESSGTVASTHTIRTSPGAATRERKWAAFTASTKPPPPSRATLATAAGVDETSHLTLPPLSTGNELGTTEPSTTTPDEAARGAGGASPDGEIERMRHELKLKTAECERYKERAVRLGADVYMVQLHKQLFKCKTRLRSALRDSARRQSNASFLRSPRSSARELSDLRGQMKEVHGVFDGLNRQMSARICKLRDINENLKASLRGLRNRGEATTVPRPPRTPTITACSTEQPLQSNPRIPITRGSSTSAESKEGEHINERAESSCDSDAPRAATETAKSLASLETRIRDLIGEASERDSALAELRARFRADQQRSAALIERLKAEVRAERVRREAERGRQRKLLDEARATTEASTVTERRLRDEVQVLRRRVEDEVEATETEQERARQCNAELSECRARAKAAVHESKRLRDEIRNLRSRWDTERGVAAAAAAAARASLRIAEEKCKSAADDRSRFAKAQASAADCVARLKRKCAILRQRLGAVSALASRRAREIKHKESVWTTQRDALETRLASVAASVDHEQKKRRAVKIHIGRLQSSARGVVGYTSKLATVYEDTIADLRARLRRAEAPKAAIKSPLTHSPIITPPSVRSPTLHRRHVMARALVAIPPALPPRTPGRKTPARQGVKSPYYASPRALLRADRGRQR